MTIEDQSLVEPRIDRVLTQYRESPNLLYMLRTYLREMEIVAQQGEAIMDSFDIRTAVGEQLTFLGRRMGWPREHCICVTRPVFGFDCGTSEYTIAGFCDDNSSWLNCGGGSLGTVELLDDELYRKFLKVRALQLDQRFDLAALEYAVYLFWGYAARVLHIGPKVVVISPGRALTSQEEAIKQLYPRVMPLPVGVRVRFHFGDNTNIFGFGTGWGGFCDTPDEAVWLCMVDVHPYDCPGES